MNNEVIREHCLSKPGVSEGFPFGQDVLVFKVIIELFNTVNDYAGKNNPFPKYKYNSALFQTLE